MKRLQISRMCVSLIVCACLCDKARSLSQQPLRGPVQGGGVQTLVVNPHASGWSVTGKVPIEISGRNLMFLADEATSGPGGTDMNADTDVLDSVVVVVDMSTNVETNLAVAAVAGKWIANELYLVVDEALDGKNWEPVDMGNTLVLLHWSAAAPALVFVDRVALAGATKMVAEGDNLFYSSARVPTSPTDSNLEVIRASAPLSHSPIPTQDIGGPLSPRILGQDEGLIFLALDESAEGRDLNGDADTLDSAVLALLDGTTATGTLRSTGLALPGTSSPYRARRTSAIPRDWQVGFLVSETAQASTNLNDPALFAASWQPVQCVGFRDADATDDVLHFLHFAAWDGNPIANPPVNTGLVGTKKIVAVQNGAGQFIGVISSESNEGTCDLNQDGDTTDEVFRWVEMTTPVLPLNTASNLHALQDVPGGTHGAAELDNRFVILVSESADNHDINGDLLKTLALIGWLSPTTAATAWDFTPGVGLFSFVGTTWMGEQPDRARLDVALEERVNNVNINAHTPPVPGEDTDTLDSVPTFADFTSGSTLSFPGVAIATDSDNAGIVVAGGNGLYRVSEAEDSRDWNGDGDELDTVLWRTSLTTSVSEWLGDLNTIPGRRAVEVGREQFSEYMAFIADETMRNLDFNSDGDTLDLVVMWPFVGRDCNNNGIADNVDIASGTSSDCNANSKPDECDLASGTSSDINGNQVPDECESAGTPFCFGDGSLPTACPCSLPNIVPNPPAAPAHGCGNSQDPSGALLTAIGTTAPDTMSFSVSISPVYAGCGVLLKGNADAPGGIASDDGIRCVDGQVIRFGAHFAGTSGASQGYWTYPNTVQTNPVSVQTAQAPGQTAYYQLFYRNAAANFCNAATTNWSNGIQIAWP